MALPLHTLAHECASGLASGIFLREEEKGALCTFSQSLLSSSESPEMTIYECHGLSVGTPGPIFVCWNLMNNVIVLRSGALEEVIRVLVKEADRSCLAPLNPCEDAARHHPRSTGEPPPDTESAEFSI